MSYLGDTPRTLTDDEVNQFFWRHPIVATQVAETKSMQAAGLYDYDYNPAAEWLFPGVIPPWGLQVQDDQFQTVTVFPARDGTWRYSGYTPDIANQPPYESPAPEGGLTQDIGNFLESSKALLMIGLAVVVFNSFRKS
jgi:hypothetical protein